jgi:conjugal transfer pilus assembly protein TraU
VLATLHRRGLAWKTMGDDALCESTIWPILPKDQYKFTMMYPMPETSDAHVIGESTMLWGSMRLIPGIEETPIYNIWRWVDCCNF